MAQGSLPCPECGQKNVAPEAGTKKITCKGCGMILVLNKVFGEDWADQAISTSAAGKPKIIRRKTRGKPDVDETKKASKSASRRRPTTGPISKKAAPKTALSDPNPSSAGTQRHTSRRKPTTGMSPIMLVGSVGGFIIVAVLALFLWDKKDTENKELAAKEAQMEADKKAKMKAMQDADEAILDMGDEADTAQDTMVKDSGDTVAGANKPAMNAKANEQPVSTKKLSNKAKRAAALAKKFAPFEDPPGLSAANKKIISDSIAVLCDLEGRGQRAAQDKLVAQRKEAIPALINSLIALDTADKDDVARGWQLIQCLRWCSEHSTKFDRFFFVPKWPEDPAVLEDDRRDRLGLVRTWHKWWRVNGPTWKPTVDSEEDF